MTQLTFDFDLETDAPAWEPIVNEFDSRACRDCGRTKYPWAHACGGTGAGGLFYLCDDCAAVDGLGARYDGAEHFSRWGIRAFPADADRLRAEQTKRRTAWRKSHSSSTAANPQSQQRETK